MPINYQFGDIVLCPDYPPPKGGKPKPRRFVVIQKFINGSFQGVAVTGSPFGKPEELVSIPSGTENAPHYITGLTKSCTIDCSWVPKISEAMIERVIGKCPPSQMEKVKQILGNHPIYKRYFHIKDHGHDPLAKPAIVPPLTDNQKCSPTDALSNQGEQTS